MAAPGRGRWGQQTIIIDPLGEALHGGEMWREKLRSGCKNVSLESREESIKVSTGRGLVGGSAILSWERVWECEE